VCESGEGEKTTMIFCTNIYFCAHSCTVTTEEFRWFFEQYGNVMDSVIMFDRMTTRSRGFGFVTFDDPHVCQQLIQMGRLPMRNDKLVEIKAAEPKPAVASGTSTTVPRNHCAHHTTRHHCGGTAAPMIPYVPNCTTVLRGAIDPSLMAMSYYGPATAMSAAVPFAMDTTMPVPPLPTFFPAPTAMPSHATSATSTSATTTSWSNTFVATTSTAPNSVVSPPITLVPYHYVYPHPYECTTNHMIRTNGTAAVTGPLPALPYNYTYSYPQYAIPQHPLPSAPTSSTGSIMTGGGGGDHHDCVGYTMYHPPVGTPMAMPWAESLEQLPVPSFIGTEVNAPYTAGASLTHTIRDDVDTTPTNTGGGGDDDDDSSSTITNIPQNNIRYDHHNEQDGESTFSTTTARTTGNQQHPV
jgi:hypothetical protein